MLGGSPIEEVLADPSSQKWVSQSVEFCTLTIFMDGKEIPTCWLQVVPKFDDSLDDNDRYITYIM